MNNYSASPTRAIRGMLHAWRKAHVFPLGPAKEDWGGRGTGVKAHLEVRVETEHRKGRPAQRPLSVGCHPTIGRQSRWSRVCKEIWEISVEKVSQR